MRELSATSTPEEVRTAWAFALESGEYPQGKLYLNNNDQFCCLGVLCELAVKAGMTERGTEILVRYEDKNGYGDASTQYAPTGVRMWAGLSSSEQQRLTVANDFYNKSFSEIAEMVRAID